MDMKKKLEKKRQELVAEFERGQTAIQALKKQADSTVATLQRIQGAIQFCNEQIEELPSAPPKKGPKRVKNEPE